MVPTINIRKLWGVGKLDCQFIWKTYLEQCGYEIELGLGKHVIIIKKSETDELFNWNGMNSQKCVIIYLGWLKIGPMWWNSMEGGKSRSWRAFQVMSREEDSFSREQNHNRLSIMEDQALEKKGLRDYDIQRHDPGQKDFFNHLARRNRLIQWVQLEINSFYFTMVQ